MGIYLQWHVHFSLFSMLISLMCFTSAVIAYSYVTLSVHYKLPWLQGSIIFLLLLTAGSLLSYNQDIRNDTLWFGNYLNNTNQIIVRINEPLQEKTASYKTEATVEQSLIGKNSKTVKGKLIIYFKKDFASLPHYGDRLLINNVLKEIKDPGNPGTFDYKKYAALQQLHYTAFLKKNDWVILKEKKENFITRLIYFARERILSILKENILGNSGELAIAEALLIGYSADLDKQMIQAYSNTGVIHIIAISGMHLGLIYVLLFTILNNIPVIKNSAFMKAIIVISLLWCFAFITGANASILRSALMFSCIIIGNNVGKQSNIYNSLAISAFILLCYNPYYLWDVGFELSYLAILGIVIFHKRLFHLISFENKWLVKLWEMISLTLTAQIFTFPICLYYFHQFPNIFLVTNVIMIPLSSLILFAEILLVALYNVPVMGIILGKVTSYLIMVMNKSILWFSKLPYASTSFISASWLSTIILYICIIYFSLWIFKKHRSFFYGSLLSFLMFTYNSLVTKLKFFNQHKLIVYNVSNHSAIDFIHGNEFKFIGDSEVVKDVSLYTYNIKPSRILYQAFNEIHQPFLYNKASVYYFNNKRVAIITPLSWQKYSSKIDVDVIVLSGNPDLKINDLHTKFNCSQYVFDNSNLPWKTARWKKDCSSLCIRSHSTAEDGAFVMDF